MVGEKDTVAAVLTGDIVNSAKVGNQKKLLEVLKDAFRDIKRNIASENDFEIYRGDSFQGIILNPIFALKAATIVRSRLIIEGKNKIKLDARIAIGIGHISYLSKKIVESDGEAFQFSGRLLDKLNHNKECLGITTPWEDLNEELAINLTTADYIINSWNYTDAEVAYSELLKNKTQNELAYEFKITQPAIHKRIYHANMPLLRILLDRFELLIDRKIDVDK